VADPIEVEVARDDDLKAVVALLEERGFEPREAEHEGGRVVEVPCEDTERTCAEVASELESVVSEAGLPLVPVQAEGRIFLGPPAG
jgi:hypothetical protein